MVHKVYNKLNTSTMAEAAERTSEEFKFDEDVIIDVNFTLTIKKHNDTPTKNVPIDNINESSSDAATTASSNSETNSE